MHNFMHNCEGMLAQLVGNDDDICVSDYQDRKSNLTLVSVVLFISVAGKSPIPDGIMSDMNRTFIAYSIESVALPFR
jgi:hypothetical protein